MLRFYIYLGFAVLVSGAVMGNRIYDMMYNFVPAAATVTKVEQLCYAERTTSSRRKGSVETLPMQPCEPLTQRIASDPSLQGFYVRDQWVVSLEYISPVDHEAHAAKVGRASGTLKANDQVKLFVSLHNPGEYFE